MPEEAILKVENLKKYYPIRGGVVPHTVGYVRAVDGVSFSVARGTTLGLVGESGCGKSTAGRQIVALEKPTAGQVWFAGKEISNLTVRQMKPLRTQLQMVFQDSYSSLNPRKRIRDALAQPMLYHKLVTRAQADAEVERLLDMVGLPKSSKGRFPYEFSGGQRQRICIAKALSLQPKFLVCDEPVSALDVSIQAQILNLLRDLQKELGLSMLFIGHGLGAVKYISSRIAVMYLGKIVEIADSAELFANPVHPYTQALCAAVPNPDPLDRNHPALLKGEAGDTPAKETQKKGCRFAPRCPFAKPECSGITPQLRPVSPGSTHLAACPFAVSAAEKEVTAS
ncbi:MAG: ABC transporter ATP-binding protein [Oscillospiraceae bacterium]|nr:ABC transporter ATP-binding protein [Oscillospiraceae bacterium]